MLLRAAPVHFHDTIQKPQPFGTTVSGGVLPPLGPQLVAVKYHHSPSQNPQPKIGFLEIATATLNSTQGTIVGDKKVKL